MPRDAPVMMATLPANAPSEPDFCKKISLRIQRFQLPSEQGFDEFGCSLPTAADPSGTHGAMTNAAMCEIEMGD
jgi:hypothetical protein